MTDLHAFERLRFPADGSVLDDLDFVVGAHERVAVFGPNGAGKTSLLRSIAGTVGDRSRRADVAYLPQRPYLFRGSARANLHLGRSERARVERLAADLRVGHLLDEPAETLSGGEAQRVAIARVLGGEEPIVLMDEPLAPIDAADRPAIAAVIRSATAGRALVCVSHSVDSAAAIADTSAILIDGRVAQRGPMAEVLALPDTEAVARIVGMSNVVEGSVSGVDSGVASVSIGSVSVTAPLEADVGDPVVMRIPAETIAVFSEEPHGASHRTVVSGSVARLIPRGPIVEIAMEGDLDLVALVTVGALDALGIAEGSTVWFGIKATAVDVLRSS